MSVFCRYTSAMTKQRGRPQKEPARSKGDYLDVRLEPAEKQAFKEAADLAGLALSAWVRERLRRAARDELGGAGQPIAFLPQRPKE